ncbi:hypothetical protein [Roseibium litorale]|uniref:Uncharacterized protein n=1 Tax=Roseibium litorale TaxID=2803841 RepID=A0ABR9CKI3_9HYPH|nr:hypothetical protein [Roseibium litorale]MBD8890920.1 hypothetical protein [Roseibium litorale]
MLSGDLRMLREQIAQRKTAGGELRLSVATVQLVEFVLADAVIMAMEMEACAVAQRKQRVVIDLSCENVTLFPRAKRPVPPADPEVVFVGIDWGRPDDGGDAA